MSTTPGNISLNRIGYLCRRYIAIKRSMILTGLAAIVSLIVLIIAAVVYYDGVAAGSAASIIIFAFMIFKLTGYALTSTMFYELNSSSTAPQFYTLPATMFEKLISAWLISFVAYTLVGLPSLYVLSLLIGLDPTWFFNIEVFNEIWTYIIIQSVFLLGAAHFRSNNFLSTVVAMLGAVILFGLAALVITSSIYPEGWFFRIPTTLVTSSTSRLISTCVITIVASAFFIWLSYLRLKKQQLT